VGSRGFDALRKHARGNRDIAAPKSFICTVGEQKLGDIRMTVVTRFHVRRRDAHNLSAICTELNEELNDFEKPGASCKMKQPNGFSSDSRQGVLFHSQRRDIQLLARFDQGAQTVCKGCVTRASPCLRKSLHVKYLHEQPAHENTQLFLVEASSQS